MFLLKRNFLNTESAARNLVIFSVLLQMSPQTIFCPNFRDNSIFLTGQRRHKLGFAFLSKKKSKRNNNKLSSFASATVFSCQSSYIPTTGYILYNHLEQDRNLQEFEHNLHDLIITCRNTCIYLREPSANLQEPNNS